MSDGSIKITIEVDGKQVEVASKELDKLEASGHKSGKGIKSAESSMDSLADSSASASKGVKGAGDAIDDLGDKSSQTGKDLKGADSAIDSLSDSSADASKSVKGTSDSLDGVSDSASDAANQTKKMKDETESMGEQTDKASDKTKKFAGAIGLIAISAAAFKVLKSAMDDAISRFDTLNKFPKVLQALGVSAEDSKKAMSDLSEGIDGLPTKLDDIAASAQEMYTSFGDMDKATDTALALNNALLGSGATAEQAKRGVQQYTKALQTDQMYLSTWNTLSETMGVGLIKIAEGFGYAGASAKNDLYQALQDGTVTMSDFNDKLIEVGTGTGIMAELARENSLGIANSLGNLQYAAARGIANIIESFDKLSKEVTGKDIAQNIDGMKHIVMAGFGVIQNVIEGATPVVKLFADGVKVAVPIVETLTPAIVGLMSAYGAYIVITKASAAIQASTAILKVAMSSQAALTLATSAQMTAQVASTTATGADIVAKSAQAGAIKLSTLALGVMTGTISLSTAAQVIATAATYALGAAWRFLMGPIGWVVAGIGLLVAGVIAVVKWFKRTSAEADRLNAETEELSDSTDALIESVDSTSEAYKDSQTEIKATAKANEDLANKVEELANKENKSAAEKAMLSSYVDQLNDSVEGLNLSYSEEADALSMSSEELQARVDLMKDQEEGIAAQERMLEISKEQNEVEMKLAETNELREEWNQSLDDGSVKAGEHKEKIEELDEKEQELKETLIELGNQQEITEEQFTTAMENITEATQSGVANQIIAFEDLSESQQATVESMKATWEDYKEAATNMFDTLSDEAELTVSEMTANLDENQRIIGEWAENIATLAERGIDQGLLDTLREAGPESAGHVNALVNASDDELSKLSDAFSKGGDTATDALSKSLGIEESGILEAIGHLIADTEQSLKQQIESADFPGIGGDVVDGMADGIEKKTDTAKFASKDLADSVTDAAKEALDTHSPSKVFEEIGESVPDGLVVGISNGAKDVLDAVKKMLKSVEDDSRKMFDDLLKGYDKSVKDIEISLKKLSVVTQTSMNNMLTRLRSGANSQTNAMKLLSKGLVSPFNNTQSQLAKIGRDAMSGLNIGLNSRRGAVLATARSIANSVASTMRRALDTHSPSRVTMGIGEDAGQGVVVGIGNKIRDVEGISRRLAMSASDNMIMTSTPEMALGTSRMAYAGSGTMNNITNSTTENQHNNVDMNGLFKGAVFNVRDDNDIPKLAKELNDYIKGGARSRGVIMP